MRQRAKGICVAFGLMLGAGSHPAVAGEVVSPRHETYQDIVVEKAEEHEIPIALALAVIQIESRFDSRARGRSGEVGLMQIKPATARGIGYTGSVERLYDPRVNLEYGLRYLGLALQRANGDECLAVMLYNAGLHARNPRNDGYCRRALAYRSRFSQLLEATPDADPSEGGREGQEAPRVPSLFRLLGIEG